MSAREVASLYGRKQSERSYGSLAGCRGTILYATDDAVSVCIKSHCGDFCVRMRWQVFADNFDSLHPDRYPRAYFHPEPHEHYTNRWDR